MSDAPTGSHGPEISVAALRALQRAMRVRSRVDRTKPSPRTSAPVPRTLAADPVMPVADALEALVARNGWMAATHQAEIHRQWQQIVGPDVAEHARPGALREATLTVETSSTAWATQLRLLAPTLQARIDGLLGAGVVVALDIQGPRPPSWRAGPRSVPGRGPRDTYG